MESHSPTYSVRELADAIGGRTVGDASMQIAGLAALDEPRPGCLTFTRAQRADRIIREIESHGAPSALLVAEAACGDEDARAIAARGITLILVKDPYAALLTLLPRYYPPPAPSGAIHPSAAIDPTAKIGKNVSIEAFCVVGAHCSVGDGAVLHPHVVLYPGAKVGTHTVLHSGVTVREHCVVGAHSVVQNGAVIGSDGFGYVPDPTVGLRSVPQVGVVELAERVDVGANACVDRATLGRTEIGIGSKVDNLVQIGHNVRIGKHSIVCGQAGIAGSVRIGDQVVIGGQAGIRDHTTIADGVRIAAQAGVVGNIVEKGDYAGFPAVPAREWRRESARTRRRPKTRATE